METRSASALCALCSALLGCEVAERDLRVLAGLLRSRALPERAALALLPRLLDLLPLARRPHKRFRHLRAAAQTEWIERWLKGSRTLARVLSGLRSLTALAVYDNERNWPRIGYDGPWLGRVPVTAYPELMPPANALSTGDDLAADVCVIGSGAGGASAAARLAERGLKVIVLERGARVSAADCTQREVEMLDRLYAEKGLAGTADQGITIMRGHGLGGSTLHNTGLVVPPPASVIERWRTEYGFCLPADALALHVQRVLTALRAVPIPEDRLNVTNRHLQAGAQALGWRHYIAQHNRLECSGCGYCMIGCAYNRKVNAAGAFLMDAAAHGTWLLPNVDAERFEGGRDHLIVHAQAADGRKFRVRVRRVVVAAGALETPLLLRRSGIRGQAIGRTLRLHPAPIVFARFPEPVAAWRGLPQAVIVNEHASFERGGRGGFLVLSNAGTGPALTAASVPGFGTRHDAIMRGYPHLASAVALLHDESAGTVHGTQGRPVVRYWPGQADRKELLRGVHAVAQLFLAGGAEEVYLPFDRGLARRAHELDDAIRNARIAPHSLPLTSVHPQGSCAMGIDRSQSAVRPNGEVWNAPGVFVADASLFPTSIGVPPQVTIMALAGAIADRVAEELGK